MEFTHLHCHTQYSLLDGACEIGNMMDKAVADGQKGIALTDHGNMFGAFKFVREARKRDIKPIVGCEFYMVEDRFKKQFLRSNNEKDKRYHQLMLAKNATGYRNLSKMCSLGYIDGLYSKYPRIDKELIEKYHEGLVATSCCIGAEIPQTILKGDIEGAEEKLKWWLNLFGEDYYIELQRHRGLESIDDTGMSQEDVNQVLLGFAKKYNVKVIATNDAHYVEEEDATPHDILLCVNTNSQAAETERFKFPSTDFYLKSQEEMTNLFHDVPEAIDTTGEILDKIELLNLEQDVLLPNFPVPPGFKDQPDFLRHLVYEGAKRRYSEITEIHRERIDRELGIIKDMGFDGYFLIVQDFIKAGREMGVRIGPGRGSAAGSVVAYCLTITDIDPIFYNLLFERFLNPERISMPDIDIDFDDAGRSRVIDYVIDKYGKDQVAQIITFGTMAARSSIRDVGRVMAVPLSDTDRVAKLVPSRPGTKLNKILDTPIKDLDYSGEDVPRIEELQTILKQQDEQGDLIRLAKKLEGNVRNTGIHAAGVIIAPSDIREHIPVCTSKDSDLYVTQFGGDVIEDAGMLKMDFLGLRTLSIINDALKLIEHRHGSDHGVVMEEIPMDDEKTFEIFQNGDTVGIFQFESDGMRKYLRELKPTSVEDLIAMNALYRPGPMDNIPSFIARKHGIEKIEYPHEWLKDILEPSYGIMVYQEQIMQAAQIMADYSLGGADMLRRAMGKKKKSEMDKHRKIFTDGAVKKGVDLKQADEIFDTMAKFASYGFNRSHSAAYSVIAYQTAYLKAHYPAEFMAAVLSHNKNDSDKLNLFLRESTRMGIKVLPPEVNESYLNFTVNAEGNIRFGLSALKGIGEGPVEAISSERNENGPYTSIFDFVRRVSLRAVNKTCLEGLVHGGALKIVSPDIHNAQYFTAAGSHNSFIEQLIRYGQYVQQSKDQAQASLFGGSEQEDIPEPTPPRAPEWSMLEVLMNEKKVAGMFLSGHPLDQYRVVAEHCTSCMLGELDRMRDKTVALAGFVASASHRISKKGTGWGIFQIRDFHGELEFVLFKEAYLDFKGRLEPGQCVFIEGKYQKRWNSDEYSLSVQSVKPLDGLAEELVSGVTVHLNADMVKPDLIKNMSEWVAEYPGGHDLKCILSDAQLDVAVPMRSGNTKLSVTSELLDTLDRKGIRYSVSTKN